MTTSPPATDQAWAIHRAVDGLARGEAAALPAVFASALRG